ncbi:MAG: TRAFs-binding domain-containing protein [Bacteroidota bacterium]
MKPFCFVLMPFGVKPDEGGRLIDFDQVYAQVIEPAIRTAGMEPIRADQETSGGIIHKAMFERLMLCDYAVADLTTANANVFYELGIRHGVRPHSTVLMFGQGSRLPFDVSPLRGLPYRIDGHGKPERPEEDRAALAGRLEACREPEEDSPLFQLVAEWPRPDIARLKTDRFRELVTYSRTVKRNLEAARRGGVDTVSKVEADINLRDADPAILVDLLLSYRAVEAFDRMADLVPRLPALVSNTVLVQEQYGLALNRLGRRDEAEKVLRKVIEEHGPSSETNGILGRVYKDLWDEARKVGNPSLARGYLRKAIDTYLAGFETDWRDAYPGVNAVMLMEMTDPVDTRQRDLIPVVRYAVRRRLATTTPDYWDYATVLELAVLASDRQAAEDALADAVAAVREPWEPKSTARQLGLIKEVRERRGGDAGWIGELAAGLTS